MALRSTLNGLNATLNARDRYKAALDEIVRLTHNQNSLLARQINDVAFKALKAPSDPGIPIYASRDATDDVLGKQ